MERIISFHNFLSPKEIKHVNRAVSVNHQVQYEDANDAVARWKGGLKFLHGNATETNLEHINGCLGLVHGYETITPQLPKAIRFSQVKYMLLLHDIDELVFGFDIPMLHPIREEKRGKQIKKIGPYLAKKRLIPSYVSADFVPEATRLYNRFLRQSSTDAEALFSRYIDKVQGLRFGCTYVFPFDSVALSTPEPGRIAHINKSLEAIMKPAIPLYRLLPQDAQSVFNTIVEGDIQRVGTIGFEEEAMTGLEKWHTSISSVHV